MLYIGVALHETLDIDRDLRVNGTQAILSAILLDEPGGSVADRLQCACPVLVAAPVDGADAGDFPRRQDAFGFVSLRDFQNSEVSRRSARDSQLLAVNDLLTASNFMSRLTFRHGLDDRPERGTRVLSAFKVTNPTPILLQLGDSPLPKATQFPTQSSRAAFPAISPPEDNR
jgi:hypothetical protein